MRGLVFFVLSTAVGVACASYGSTDDVDDRPAMDAGPTEAGPSVVAEAGGALEVDAAPNDFRAAVSSLPNLVGYWRLDDLTTSIPRDTSGAYVGKVVGAPPSTADSLLPQDDNAAGTFASGALVFDGSGHPLGLLGPTFTIGVIAKPLSTDVDAFLLYKDKAFGLGISAARTPFFDLPDLAHRFAATSTLPSGSRVLLVAAFDEAKSEATVWVNGVARRTSIIRPSPGALTPFCIGAGLSDCTAYNFHGILDEVFITRDVLTDPSVQALTELAGLP